MSETQEPLPTTISRSTVLIVSILMLLAGSVGFAFGADAGYSKGFHDAQRAGIEPLAVQMP